MWSFEKNNTAHRVVVARNGVEALDYLYGTGTYTGRDVCDRPQLTPLDLKLPEMDELDVLKRIRAHESMCCIPVVILTSSVEENDLAWAYHCGTNAYVRKPVDFIKFMDAIKELGEFWLGLNQSTRLCGTF